MATRTMSRRERLRAETAAEIKTVALRLMADGGPDAISLRAIAREMGMTAGAIYGYYPTRDDLITALIQDVYTDLVRTVEAARDARPAGDVGGRILAWAEAFRQWSLANPQGFRLVYGDPVPGYRPPEAGPAAEAAHRACTGLTGLAVAARPYLPGPADAGYDWEDFDPALAGAVRQAFPDAPPDVLALALRLWGRMHGLVALEIYHHLRASPPVAARLYRAELVEFLATLGIPAERTADPAGRIRLPE